MTFSAGHVAAVAVFFAGVGVFVSYGWLRHQAWFQRGQKTPPVQP